jgi:hypothetical protein
MKHNIKWLFFLVAVLLLSGCPQEIPGNPEVTYEIGDTGPGGGLIFFDKGSSNTKMWYWDGTSFFEHPTEVGTTSWRYLEAAPASTESDSQMVWGGYTTEVGSGAQSQYLGDGKTNTEAIVLAYGENEPYNSQSVYAAKYCDDLISGGKTDWFLPSKHEAKAMYENIQITGAFATNFNYWTSTEDSAVNGTVVEFDEIGAMNNSPKNLLRKVRAIRMF